MKHVIKDNCLTRFMQEDFNLDGNFLEKDSIEDAQLFAQRRNKDKTIRV